MNEDEMPLAEALNSVRLALSLVRQAFIQSRRFEIRTVLELGEAVGRLQKTEVAIMKEIVAKGGEQ